MLQASNLAGTSGIFSHRKRLQALKSRNNSAAEALAFAHNVKEQELVNGSPSHSSHFSYLGCLSSNSMQGFPWNWCSRCKLNTMTFSNPVLPQMSTQVALLPSLLLATRGRGLSPEETSKNKQSTGVLCNSD